MFGTGKENVNWHWPEERVAELKKVWADLSASKIGEMFGMTRNAVIGKAHRLGLSGQKKQSVKRKKYVLKRPRLRTETGKFATANYQPPPPPVAIPEPESLNRTIMEIGLGECRYPHGDYPPFFYCGQPIEEGSPYCEFHHGIANVTPPPRRDANWHRWNV